MSTTHKLKHSIYSTSRQISREVGSNLNNMEFESDALDLIAELTWKKLSLYGLDLEAFQKHAKRSTINVDDVRLLVRRNDSLRELMDAKLHTISKPVAEASSNSAAAASKRKRK